MTVVLVIWLSTIKPELASVFLVIKGLMMPYSYLPRPLPFQPMFSIIFLILLSEDEAAA
jgi:hypothetical protein